MHPASLVHLVVPDASGEGVVVRIQRVATYSTQEGDLLILPEGADTTQLAVSGDNVKKAEYDQDDGLRIAVAGSEAEGVRIGSPKGEYSPAIDLSHHSALVLRLRASGEMVREQANGQRKHHATLRDAWLSLAFYDTSGKLSARVLISAAREAETLRIPLRLFEGKNGWNPAAVAGIDIALPPSGDAKRYDRQLDLVVEQIVVGE